MLLAIVPNAAPIVPNLGIRITLKHDRQHRHRHAEPQRRVRITGGAEGAAQHEEHHHAEDADEHCSQERQRLVLHLRRGVDDVEQRRRGEVADGRQQHRQAERREKRLVDDAVDLLRLVRAGESRDQDAHPGEQRADEDDDDEDDLPADANGGVAVVADEIARPLRGR